MGIISPNIQPFNLSANYGALPSNRGQLFNAAYSVELGNRVHMNALVNGLANGWQLSGITQLESGANLTYGGNGFGGNAINGNYNAAYTCVATAAEMASGHPCPQSSAIIPGSISTANPTGIAINNQSILGTNGQELHPYLTCNPRGHVLSHQFVNGACFAAPTIVGQNGPTLLPAVYGPAFVDSDLAVFKNFAPHGKNEAADTCAGLQLPEPSSVFVPEWQQQPDPAVYAGSGLASNHPDEYQLRYYNPEARRSHYGVWGEVLLLVGYIKSNGINSRASDVPLYLFCTQNSSRYAEALSSFCVNPRPSLPRHRAGTDVPAATDTGRHAKAAGWRSSRRRLRSTESF